jgi:sialidase-1
VVTKTPLPLMDENTVTEIGENGEIMINMRSTERKRAVAVSTDGGETFGEITFDESLEDPICEGSIATI